MKKESFYLAKLEWLGSILARGLKLLTSVEALGQEFSFSQVLILQARQGGVLLIRLTHGSTIEHAKVVLF